ncbi:MAG: hypothetical protein K1X81_13945 [Bacteroidia bacterium]|nr:hypothetical protein [Bacteroidia bacterium]
MSHIKLLLLLTSLSCLSLHCKKESELDKLPPATAIGANTFGCLLNGKAWPIGAKGDHMTEVHYSKGILSVRYATRLDPFSSITNESVTLRTNKIHEYGSYFISYNDINEDFFSVGINGNIYSSAFNNTNGFAFINISRLDSINHYVSGTFEFSLNDFNNSSKIKVSSGRFDFRYQ